MSGYGFHFFSQTRGNTRSPTSALAPCRCRRCCCPRLDREISRPISTQNILLVSVRIYHVTSTYTITSSLEPRIIHEREVKITCSSRNNDAAGLVVAELEEEEEEEEKVVVVGSIDDSFVMCYLWYSSENH